MTSLSFLLQYITRPRTVGAILPSSKYLAAKMVKNIDFENAACIAEYGPGTGVFTQEILRKRSPGTLVLLFEKNEIFCRLLEEKYGKNPNLHIINDSAENIGRYLSSHNLTHVDCIISGLPFASIPQEVSENILAQTKCHLKPGGLFVTFQYTLFKKDFLMRFFPKIEIAREIRNIPPAYVFCCRMGM